MRARSSATTITCSAASTASTASRPATPALPGFNLLTSVHRDGRSLIAVVMGGRTAGARDRIMENLIADHIAEASTVRTATMVADASDAEEPARPRRERGDAAGASASGRRRGQCPGSRRRRAARRAAGRRRRQHGRGRGAGASCRGRRAGRQAAACRADARPRAVERRRSRTPSAPPQRRGSKRRAGARLGEGPGPRPSAGETPRRPTPPASRKAVETGARSEQGARGDDHRRAHAGHVRPAGPTARAPPQAAKAG